MSAALKCKSSNKKTTNNLLGRNISSFARLFEKQSAPDFRLRYRNISALLYAKARNNPPLAIIKYLKIFLGQFAHGMTLRVADYDGDQHRIHFDYDFGRSVLGWRASSHLRHDAHAQQKTQAAGSDL